MTILQLHVAVRVACCDWRPKSLPKSSLEPERIPYDEDVKHDVESPGLLPNAAWPKVPDRNGTVKPVELSLKVAMPSK